jgi:predicted DNA-binding transcriptional regulator AlpA
MNGPDQHAEGGPEAKGDNASAPHGEPRLAALKLFVELSGLRIPRVAKLMGVGDATLYKWLEGTARPTPKKLLEIETFLAWHGREYLPKSEGHEQ